MENSTASEALAIAISAGVPVLLWGSPGTEDAPPWSLSPTRSGGRAIVIGSIREPTDFGGLPVVVDGGVRLAPPSCAQRLVAAGHGLLFLDELTTAPPAVQAAMLRVIFERVVGDGEAAGRGAGRRGGEPARAGCRRLGARPAAREPARPPRLAHGGPLHRARARGRLPRPVASGARRRSAGRGAAPDGARDGRGVPRGAPRPRAPATALGGGIRPLAEPAELEAAATLLAACTAAGASDMRATSS